MNRPIIMEGLNPFHFVEDVPEDCHRHCAHWDTEGECCECGDVRTPNHHWEKPLFADEMPDNEEEE